MHFVCFSPKGITRIILGFILSVCFFSTKLFSQIDIDAKDEVHIQNKEHINSKVDYSETLKKLRQKYKPKKYEETFKLAEWRTLSAGYTGTIELDVKVVAVDGEFTIELESLIKHIELDVSCNQDEQKFKLNETAGEEASDLCAFEAPLCDPEKPTDINVRLLMEPASLTITSNLNTGPSFFIGSITIGPTVTNTRDIFLRSAFLDQKIKEKLQFKLQMRKKTGKGCISFRDEFRSLDWEAKLDKIGRRYAAESYCSEQLVNTILNRNDEYFYYHNTNGQQKISTDILRAMIEFPSDYENDLRKSSVNKWMWDGVQYCANNFKKLMNQFIEDGSNHLYANHHQENPKPLSVTLPFEGFEGRKFQGACLCNKTSKIVPDHWGEHELYPMNVGTVQEPKYITQRKVLTNILLGVKEARKNGGLKAASEKYCKSLNGKTQGLHRHTSNLWQAEAGEQYYQYSRCQPTLVEGWNPIDAKKFWYEGFHASEFDVFESLSVFDSSSTIKPRALMIGDEFRMKQFVDKNKEISKDKLVAK